MSWGDTVRARMAFVARAAARLHDVGPPERYYEAAEWDKLIADIDEMERQLAVARFALAQIATFAPVAGPAAERELAHCKAVARGALEKVVP